MDHPPGIAGWKEDRAGTWGVVRIKREAGASPLHGYIQRVLTLSSDKHSARIAGGAPGWCTRLRF